MIPKVILEGKIQLSEDCEITVCVLDDGRRIIPEDDMLKALKFLGLNDQYIASLLESDKINQQ